MRKSAAEAPARGPSAHGGQHACAGCREKTAGDAAETGQNWLGNSVWRSPEVELLRIKAWASMTAASYHRGAGESVWRGDRHRIVLTLDALPRSLVQIEQGHTQEFPVAPPGVQAFSSAGLTIRSVHPAGRFVHGVWDTYLYSTLLPELAAAASRSGYEYPLEDLLLSQIVTTLVQEIEGGFADKILIESLDTALCIRIAQRFVGAPRATDPQGSLAGAAAARTRLCRGASRWGPFTHCPGRRCLFEPYHFSRSFKEAAGVGPQRYVMQRRLARARSLMRRTHQPSRGSRRRPGLSTRAILPPSFAASWG